jgi:hypothetical protein
LSEERNMNQYSEFVDKLHVEFNTFLSTPKTEWYKRATSYVDGFAAEELRRLVNIETRRDYGAFFTDSLLAKKVLELLKPTFTSESFIYDAACGAGNLLIAVSDYIKKSDISFDDKPHLFGTDLHIEFTEAAKIRLRINNLLKQTNSDTGLNNYKNENEYSIIAGDGLLQNSFYEKATHIFVNPPFNQIIIDEKLSWASGKLSAAALFIDKIIQYSNPGTSIIAILPDVLRSGTRYEKWRAMVEKECIIEKTKLLGQFDKYADVDVYAVMLTKREKPLIKNTKTTKGKIRNANHLKTIDDLFDVCVGPVVDNRDAMKGPSYPYIVSRGLQGWSLQTGVTLTRKHEGKSFESPFVVIKRTSRMGDAQRAIATIINIPNPVFVDNHLIILKPKSGKIKDCKEILSVLRDTRTDEWLNNKIRCRHLTVKIVGKILVR